MRIVRWLAPFAFAGAFVLGYQDSPRAGPVPALIAAAIVVAAGAAGLTVRALGIRLWSAANSLLAGSCALGMLDNVFHHNNYSGYGAFILLPLAAIAALSMLVLAIASRRS
jgi:hypothetical protein